MERIDLYGDGSMMIPAKYAVCPQCEGRGSHVDPNIDGNGITADSVDPYMWEDYLAGIYDIACTTCGGRRVVLEPDIALCTSEELEELLDKEKVDREMDAHKRENMRRSDCARM